MALAERIHRTIDATHWRGEIPLNYIYTPGRAGEQFLRALLDEETFLGARCAACGVTYVPARIFCERCFARIEDSFVKLGKRGTVHAFTVSHETFDGVRKEEPSIVALIKLDGADGVVLHRLGDVDPGDVRVGLPVEAVFKPKKDRQGSILDVRHFRPAKG